MKFIICFALVLAAAQAHVVGPAVTYSAAPVVSAAYTAPLAFRSAPIAYAAPAYTTYNAAYTAPALTRSVYSAPSVYGFPTTYGAPAAYVAAPAAYAAAPAVYSTLLKK